MKRRLLLTLFLLVAARAMTVAQTGGGTLQLVSGDAQLAWNREADGWHIRSVDVAGKPLGQPSGAYTLLYINRHAAGNLVDMDLEGTDFTFYAGEGAREPDGSLVFRGACRVAELEARWEADPAYPGDFRVRVTVTARQKGSFAISTPTLTAIDSKNDLDWGMIPGNWYGHEVQKDFTLATHYSQGVPAIPYLAKERNTMTLCPLVTTREKVTLAVIPDPGTAQDPWEKDVNTREGNKLAMSLMNRHNQLTPTAYSPVLGQKGSFLSPGDKVSFSFRYSLRATDWWPVF
ncbi:MAG TPA: hypothetical protein VHI52_15215, partial [Verrucomicrobiae bacterium]|nr:hypothetical protein [Verrucomicrobiae bacterium]